MLLYRTIDTATRNESWRALQAGVDPVNVRYVSPSFNNTSPNYSTIQAAIDDLTSGLVIVYPGEYSETVSMKDNVYVYAYAGAVLIRDASQIGVVFDSTTNAGLYGALEIRYDDYQATNEAIKILSSARNIHLEFDSSINGVIMINLSYAASVSDRINLNCKFNKIGLLRSVSSDSTPVLFERIRIEAHTIQRLELNDLDNEVALEFYIDCYYGETHRLYRLIANTERLRYIFSYAELKMSTEYLDIEQCSGIEYKRIYLDTQYAARIRNSNMIFFREYGIKSVYDGIRYESNSQYPPYNELHLHNGIIECGGYPIVNPTTNMLGLVITASAFNNSINNSYMYTYINDYVVEAAIKAF